MRDSVAPDHKAKASAKKTIRSSSAKTGKLPINLISNIANLCLSIGIGLFYVPFLVRTLGPAVYGVVPLVTALTQYMALITSGLNSSVGRSITIAIEKEEDEKAISIFNTSIIGSLILGLVISLLAIIGYLFLDKLIKIPEGKLIETKIAYGCVIFAFLVTQLRTPFDVAHFCRNRFDLKILVDAGDTIFRLSIVLGLFFIFSPSLSYVGFAIASGAVFSASGALILWRKLTPSLHIRFRSFDLTTLKQLLHTGGWVVVSQVGTLLYINIDLFVANHTFGAEASGRYAAVLQLAILIRALAASVNAVFFPTVLYLYAKKDIDALILFLRRAIKFCGLVLALPIGLICGLGEPLLYVWLGPTFTSMAPLLFIMTFHLCLNLSVYPLYGLPLATNRVKVPGLVTLGLGLGNLILALLLTGPLNLGLIGLPISGAVTLLIRHTFFTPLYGAYILKRPKLTFMTGMISNLAMTGFVILVSRIVLLKWELHHWLDLGIAGILISLLYLAVAWRFLLSEEERKLLVAQLNKIALDRRT